MTFRLYLKIRVTKTYVLSCKRENEVTIISTAERPKLYSTNEKTSATRSTSYACNQKPNLIKNTELTTYTERESAGKRYVQRVVFYQSNRDV